MVGLVRSVGYGTITHNENNKQQHEMRSIPGDKWGTSGLVLQRRGGGG